MRNGGAGAAGMTVEKNIELNEVVRIRILRTISLEHTVFKLIFDKIVEAEGNNDLYILISSWERITITTKTSSNEMMYNLKIFH